MERARRHPRPRSWARRLLEGLDGPRWAVAALATVGLAAGCHRPTARTVAAATPAPRGEAAEGTEGALGGDAGPGPAAPGAGPVAGGPCAEVGYGAPPRPPSADARRANEAALRAHGLGRYEESLEGFREAARLSPSYGMAHFNAACALARLGRRDEAWAELEPLLCEDLPTFAPRLAADPDLATLAEEGWTRAPVEAIAAEYREAARGGAPLVAFGRTARGQWSQAVAYVAGEGRAVPMGPRVSVEGDFPLAATVYDPAEDRVLAVTASGNDAEGPVPLFGVRVRTFRAPLGEVEVDHAAFPELYWLRAGLVASGVRLASWDEDQHPLTWNVTAAGLDRTSEPVPVRTLSVGVQAWAPASADPRYPVSRGRLLLPGGREVVLGSPHPALGGSRVFVDEGVGVAFAVSQRSGYCDAPDRHVVDRVDLASGAVDRVLLGEGQAIVSIGPDGALYVQISTYRRTETRRYPDLRSNAFDVLPAGFGLSSSPFDYNPMC